jgi:hypothetical protein
LLALIKLCVLNPDKRPHILPDQFVKERAWPTAPFGATCCLKRGAYSTATRFSVNRFFSFSVSVLSTQTTIRQSLKKRNDEPKNHLIQHLTTCSIDLP